MDDGDDDSSMEGAQISDEKSREQLELLLTGEHEEEQSRDYDIGGIQRMEKNEGKKIEGCQKAKEARVAADASGADFKVNIHDDRFRASLARSDDRFGIDKIDPNFQDTSAMREIRLIDWTRNAS
ncbi:hypothetical protein ACA910_020094 [Epithemia clementina (nom. ined.)]